METISINHSRKDYGVGAILATIMFAASLFVLFGSVFTEMPFRFFGLESAGMGLLAGGLGSLFFGYGFFFLWKRFVFPDGALVISSVGIVNRTNALGTRQLILFQDMKEAKFEMVQASPNIGIVFYDNEKYLMSLPFLKRKASEINHHTFKTSVLSLDVPVRSRERVHELVDIINERIERSKSI